MPASAPPAPAPTLPIDRLGHHGDGIGRYGDKDVYVPYALPGETVSVTLGTPKGPGIAAKLESVLTPSSLRAAPPCPHFGICGGCVAQHMAGDFYREWKKSLLLAALRQRGFSTDLPVSEIISVPPRTRRRASLAAYRHKTGVLLGFHQARSHAVVAVTDCTVLHPKLHALLPALQEFLTEVLRQAETADLLLTWTDSGADLVLSGSRGGQDRVRRAAASIGVIDDIARLSLAAGPEQEPELILLNRAPVIRFDDIAVEIPPGPFLQPTVAGEAAMRHIAIAATKGAKHVADLFSGCGTFALSLAKTARILAADHQRSGLSSLTQAARAHGLADHIHTLKRDLMRNPLGPKELAGFDAVIIDPPRAGARAEAEALAQSAVKTIIAISCDPATFARDLRILVDGGYRIESLTPVDQFLWSAHLELVAVLRR